MTQVSDIGQEEAWGWPCPYCRSQNAVDAVQCAHCGSQLREADGDDLFTTVAADYAEVVPPEVPFARDNMWTTDANAGGPLNVEDAVGDSELVDDVFDAEPDDAGDDLWDDQPWPHDPNGFSAEPTVRRADVIDEPLGGPEDADVGRSNGNGGPLFAGRANGTNRPPPAASSSSSGTSPFGVPGAGTTASAHSTTPPPGVPPFSAVGQAPAGQPAASHSSAGQPPQYAEPAPVSSWSAPTVAPPVPDAHGLAAAVGRLRPEAAEAAAVPISVCGALLGRDEVVLAAVTGQMLGHAAVVVLTSQRVLVVNGRRWQPIVDQFSLSPELVVRGRHDRDIASLTFSEGDQLSTVDAITEVALAVEVAERIRGI